MALDMPLPVPPRTPTPPLEERDLNRAPADASQPPQSPMVYDRNALSPMVENFPPRYSTLGSSNLATAPPLSPASPTSYYSAGSLDSAGTSHSPSHDANPFKFKTMTLAKSPLSKSTVGQRRGHKYKHSSVSHQVFQEPPPRAPLALPASLPVPTFKECRKSLSREQRSRITWCLCHAAVAVYTLWSAQGSLAMTALSHLILFDALGATLCVIVDVLGNFEVWKRPSIRHPFGLERVEVLAGFAMSVFLLFMGLDLISHNMQHLLESLGHEAHHAHHHDRVSPGSVDIVALLAIISTLVSAIGLGNHARIGKAMRFAYIESLPFVLSNPSHFLTLSCSVARLLLPLLSVQMYAWLDRFLSGTIALSMGFLGVRLVRTLGLMLLMSYSGDGVAQIIKDIEKDASVNAVEEASFWQVHYGLCMGNLKLRVQGTEQTATRLRDRITSLVRNRLGGGYGGGGQRWEVSTQITLENIPQTTMA